MKKMEIKYIKIWNALTNIDEKNKIKQHIHEKNMGALHKMA